MAFRPLYRRRNAAQPLQARKEEREMRFSLEESMAELSELAGTAGLEVAGSTYQRVLEPNPRTYIGTGKVCSSSRQDGGQ